MRRATPRQTEAQTGGVNPLCHSVLDPIVDALEQHADIGEEQAPAHSFGNVTPCRTYVIAQSVALRLTNLPNAQNIAILRIQGVHRAAVIDRRSVGIGENILPLPPYEHFVLNRPSRIFAA